MKQLFSILLAASWMVASVPAAERISALITVTNTPSDGNTLVINSDTRTWKETLATPASQILISTNGIGDCATNLFLHIAANPFAGPLTVSQPATNQVRVTGTVGGALAASLTGTWGTITLSTQAVTTAYVVRVPASAEPNATAREAIWNGVVDGINDEASTTFDSTAPALANLVSTDQVQTVSGDKTFTGETRFTDSVTVTNAQQYFRLGAGITVETNLLITDLNSGIAFWQLNTAEQTNGLVTFQGVTNKLTALKAADNTWTGLQTMARVTGGMTNAVLTNSATGAGTFTLGSDIAFTRANHTSLANGNNAGIDFGSSTVYAKIKAGPTAAFTINGITGGRNGRWLVLDNATGQTMTIANDSGVDATAANRILTRVGSDVSAGPGGCVALVYDSEGSRWILVDPGTPQLTLSMPSPFSVSGSPVINAGTFAVTLPSGTTGSGALALGTSPNFLTAITLTNTGADAEFYVRGLNSGADARVKLDGFDGSQLDFRRNGVDAWRLERVSGTDDLYLKYDAVGGGGTFGNTSMFWKYSDGSVGIGHASPSATLDVSGSFKVSGDVVLSKTITAAGTTGNQTINKLSGSVNFAASTQTITVTDSFVTANSVIIATVATDDTTAKSCIAVAGSGSFTLKLNAAATAETRVNFLVTN